MRIQKLFDLVRGGARKTIHVLAETNNFRYIPRRREDCDKIRRPPPLPDRRREHGESEPAWERECRKARASLDIPVPMSATPWTGQAGIHLHGISRTQRTFALIDTAYLILCQKYGQDPENPEESWMDGLYIDTSQNLSRHAYGRSTSISAGQNTCCYSYFI